MFIRITIIDPDNKTEIPTILDMKEVNKFDKVDGKVYVYYNDIDPADGARYNNEIKNTMEEIGQKLVALGLLKN